MADLLNFDDDYDFFTEHKQGELKDSNKELDDLFDINSGQVSDDSLDDILKPSSGDIKPSAKPVKKRQKSFKKKSRPLQEDEFDPFSPPSQKSSTDQLVPPTVESGTKPASSSVTSIDSLDFLLDSQPLGTVPSSDDLLSLDPFSTPVVRKKDDSKDQGGDSLDPFWSPETDSSAHEVSKNVDLLSDFDFLSAPKSQREISEKPTNDIFLLNDEQANASAIDEREDLIGQREEVNKRADLFGLGNEETNETEDLIGLDRKEFDETSKQGPSFNNDIFGTKDEHNYLFEELQASVDDDEIRHDDVLTDQCNEVATAPSMTAYQLGEQVTGDDSNNEGNNKLPSEVLNGGSTDKDSPLEKSNPIQDIFESPDDIEVGADRAQDVKAGDTKFKDTPHKGKQGKAKPKKSMERSFEDLLHGLSDESEPELDNMILSDDNDNTNLESILVSPGQSKPKIGDKNSEEFSTPVRHASNTDDIMTSTPGMDTGNEPSSDIKASPIEIKVHKPDDDGNEDNEDLDVKSWEIVDKEDSDNMEPRETEAVEEQAVFDDINDDISDVVMRNRNRSASGADSANDKEIDLSAIEDANHLDVDISKHKSALGKKGSMALRRKQSRKSRRSVMADGEDAIFVDSTGPKSSEIMNGDGDLHDDLQNDLEDDKDSENFDMSPPAKKPSPSMMVPMPSLSSRPPSQRLSSSTPDDNDEEIPKATKRISKPPPGAFILPDVTPRLTPKPSPSVETKKETNFTSHTFEKPALRSSKPTPVKQSSKDDQHGFETPALRSVQRRERERPSVGEARDVTFEKPALRSTSKSREQTPESKLEPESDSLTRPHTFDKPKLRSTSKTEINDKADEQKKNESSIMFEKPVLRSTKVEKQGSFTEDSDNVLHTFEKPALKSTGFRGSEVNKDTGNIGLFDKPALRKTPSPEKEVRPPHEPKGTFDKPSLRKTENSPTVSDISFGKSDYKSSFPEMKLRKTTSPQKEVVTEKPSWLKDAAEKGSKVLDVLHSKENTNSSSKKEVPSWLDKTPVLKSSRGQPLQDTSNNHTEFTDGNWKVTPRSREPSIGSENDPESRRTSTSESKSTQNNYVPSWMRQGRSPSIGSPGLNSPAKIIKDSDEVPQWKKELAQRRASRKEQSPVFDTPKQDGSSEPEWKKNIQLRKTRPGDTPARDKQSVEPEWKKAAEEKRARLRKSTIEN